MGQAELTFVQIIGKKEEYVTQISLKDLCKYWKSETSVLFLRQIGGGMTRAKGD